MTIRTILICIIIFLLYIPRGVCGSCVELLNNQSNLKSILLSLNFSDLKNVNRYLEQRVNVERYTQVSGSTDVDFVQIQNLRLTFGKSADGRELFNPNIPDLLPIHPLNQDTTVPGMGMTPQKTLKGFLSASRSIIFENLGLSFKVATDYPNPLLRQSKKTNLDLDLSLGLKRSDWIRKIDQKLGLDPDLVILLEIAMISVSLNPLKGTLIRDISPTLDGNIYIPGFSIPFFKNSELSKKFVQSLGKAKAKLLIRYGLQMETPNWQNMLQPVNGLNLKPKDSIVLRDVSDWFFVKPIIDIIGDNKVIYDERLLEQSRNLELFFGQEELSTGWRWRRTIDLLKESDVSETTLSQWEEIHDSSYANEISKLLQIKIVKLNDEHWIDAVKRVLFSEKGLRALGEFHGINSHF